MHFKDSVVEAEVIFYANWKHKKRYQKQIGVKIPSPLSPQSFQLFSQREPEIST